MVHLEDSLASNDAHVAEDGVGRGHQNRVVLAGYELCLSRAGASQ